MVCPKFMLMFAARAFSTVGLALQVFDDRHPISLVQRPGTNIPLDEQLRFGRDSMPKSMPKQFHTVSKVSARWGGNVVYAIFTSKIPKYHDNLLTQLATWAQRPASEGRYVAVGGDDYPEQWQHDGTILKSTCPDSMIGIACKEATLLAEGAARGAAWLVIVGEDNYVNTRMVDQVLQHKNPNNLEVYGMVGCGAGLFCRDSPDFERMGGLCGGSGYILSGATLQQLLKDGAPALHKVFDASKDPNDMTTSCLLRKSGVRFKNLPGMNGSPIFSERELLQHEQNGFLTLHYLRPAVMHWLHAVVEHREPGAIERLESQAFDRGCAIGMNTTHWMDMWAACIGEWELRQRESSSTAALQ